MLHETEIRRATDTLCAIAAIPDFRGGVVQFDEDDGLLATWFPSFDDWAAQAKLGSVWTVVPEEPQYADCRLKVETALEEARRTLTDASMCGLDFVLRTAPEVWTDELGQAAVRDLEDRLAQLTVR